MSELERKGIRQSIRPGQIHMVRNQDGQVWLATKEGACWVGLWGELLMFVEDLGSPEDLAGELARLRHLARLLDQEGDRIAGLVGLARDLKKGRSW